VTASKNLCGKVGIGIYINFPNNLEPLSFSIRLNNDLSIYKAELYAIFHSLQIIESLDNISDISIFTDSLSAAHSIKINRSKTNNHLVNDINEVTHNLQNKIEIVWIPSHLGIKGNEIADKLANQAINHTLIDIHLPFEIIELTENIISEIDNTFQKIWSSTNCPYETLHPSFSRHVPFPSRTRRDENLITRLRLGKVNLNYYLQKLDKHPTGLSDNCKTLETITHFLFECNSPLVYKINNWCSYHNLARGDISILNNNQIRRIIVANVFRDI
jgi:ribonuclease HI